MDRVYQHLLKKLFGVSKVFTFQIQPKSRTDTNKIESSKATHKLGHTTNFEVGIQLKKAKTIERNTR